MTIDSLKKVILSIANKYPIKKVFLFGSRAEKTDHENSDVDLIMEFFVPISESDFGDRYWLSNVRRRGIRRIFL